MHWRVSDIFACYWVVGLQTIDNVRGIALNADTLGALTGFRFLTQAGRQAGRQADRRADRRQAGKTRRQIKRCLLAVRQAS